MTLNMEVIQKQGLYRHNRKQGSHAQCYYSSANLFLNYLHDHLTLKFLQNNILGKQIGLLLKIQLFIISELVIKLLMTFN